MRLFRANLRKLRSRPATWVTFVLLVALHTLVTFFVVLGSRISTDPQAALGARQFLTFPTAYELILSLVIGIGGLLAVTYGAAIAGAEWAWGTLKAAVARGEGRATYTLLGFAGVAVYTWLGILGAFLAGVMVTAIGALLTGVSLSGMGDADALAGFFAPHVLKWFPFTASGAVVGNSGGGSVVVNGTEIGATLDPTTAIVVTCLWLAASLAVAVLRTERAEIGG
jgi:hypothetical protein